MIEPAVLTTDRLTLRPLTVDDAQALYSVYSHPLAMRYWHTPLHASVAVTRATIVSLLSDTACWWAICRRADGQAIGLIGYLGNEGAPGMGYLLHPAWWRQGYMTEALRAALEHGFDQLGLDRAELWIDADNSASQKLAETVGFTRRGRFIQRHAHREAAHETLVYGILAREWRGDEPAPAAGASLPCCYGLQPILAVRDVQATARFYRDLLDFRIAFLSGDPPTYGAVSYGEWTTEGAQIRLAQRATGRAVDPRVELYIVVGPSIDDRYERYRARGAPIAASPVSRPWGEREFAIRDCNGYVLWFSTPE